MIEASAQVNMVQADVRVMAKAFDVSAPGLNARRDMLGGLMLCYGTSNPEKQASVRHLECYIGKRGGEYGKIGVRKTALGLCTQSCCCGGLRGGW